MGCLAGGLWGAWWEGAGNAGGCIALEGWRIWGADGPVGQAEPGVLAAPAAWGSWWVRQSWGVAVAPAAWGSQWPCGSRGLPPQVLYVSTLFPYLVLFCLLVRGLLLEGAPEGIRIMFTPKVSPCPRDPQPCPDRPRLPRAHCVPVCPHRCQCGGQARPGGRQPRRSSSRWDWASAASSLTPATARAAATATATPCWWLASMPSPPSWPPSLSSPFWVPAPPAARSTASAGVGGCPMVGVPAQRWGPTPGCCTRRGTPVSLRQHRHSPCLAPSPQECRAGVASAGGRGAARDRPPPWEPHGPASPPVQRLAVGAAPSPAGCPGCHRLPPGGGDEQGDAGDKLDTPWGWGPPNCTPSSNLSYIPPQLVAQLGPGGSHPIPWVIPPQTGRGVALAPSSIPKLG